MAILLADGFDFYTSATDMVYVGAPWISAVSGISLDSTTPYGVGQSCKISAGAAQLFSTTFSNESTIYISLNLYSSTSFVFAANQGFCIILRETSGNQVTLHWAQDGNFYVRAGDNTGAILGTFAHGMAAASWCHWQCKVVINSTTGSVELRKNNNTVDDYSVTNINTRNGTSNTYANNLVMNDTGGSYQWYFDDFFVNSGSGAAPNTWPTQLRAIQLMPNADTAQKDMTPLSAGSNYLMVNEAHMNSDTNYVYGSTAGNTDLYNLQDLSIVPTAIPLVVIRHSLRKSDTGARTGTTHLLSGGTAQDSSTVTLATTYQWQNTYLPTDPNTSAAWTYAAVNALQVGPKVVS